VSYYPDDENPPRWIVATLGATIVLLIIAIVALAVNVAHAAPDSADTAICYGPRGPLVVIVESDDTEWLEAHAYGVTFKFVPADTVGHFQKGDWVKVPPDLAAGGVRACNANGCKSSKKATVVTRRRVGAWVGGAQ